MSRKLITEVDTIFNMVVLVKPLISLCKIKAINRLVRDKMNH